MTGQVVWESKASALRVVPRKRYVLEHRDPRNLTYWWPIHSFRFKWNAMLSAKSLEDLFVTRIVDTKPEMVRQSLYDRAFAS